MADNRDYTPFLGGDLALLHSLMSLGLAAEQIHYFCTKIATQRITNLPNAAISARSLQTNI